MSYRMNKKKYGILLLVFVLAIMGVGYAYLSTTVNFNGTASISSTQWNIYLDNIQVTDGSVTPTTAVSINDAKTEVTYGVTLVNPGDFYEFTVDIKNDGSIDGMIENISSKLNNTEITTLPDYLEYDVSYSSGVDILPNHFLKASTHETYKVRIGFKKDITADQLPTENQTLNLSFSVSYKQADENGVDVVHQLTRYTVNRFDSSDRENSQVYINQPISEKIVQYKTVSDARANFENRPMYLKHIIEGGNVKESYVEFVVSEELATANEGMTAGTYALKGGDSGAAYESNKEVLKTAFGESHCTDKTSYFHCSMSDLEARADNDGYVHVNSSDYSFSCAVYIDVSVCNRDFRINLDQDDDPPVLKLE